MKSFICDQIRVLFVEGEPCNYIIVDIFYPSCSGMKERIGSKEVAIGKEEYGNIEVQCVKTNNGNSEGIFAKICTQEEIKDEADALAILKKVYRKMGLSLEDGITCVLEA